MKVNDVRMNFLVNSNSHGIGISSARAPNMTCKCDYISEEVSCQCFHSSYHVSSALESKDLQANSLTVTTESTVSECIVSLRRQVARVNHLSQNFP